MTRAADGNRQVSEYRQFANRPADPLCGTTIRRNANPGTAFMAANRPGKGLARVLEWGSA